MLRRRKMSAKREEAVRAVERGLDYAASEVYTDEEDEIVAAARAALRMLEGAGEETRAEAAEARLAGVIPGLRLLAEGCLDLASNGTDLDRHTSASLAYRSVATDILAIIGSEEGARHG